MMRATLLFFVWCCGFGLSSSFAQESVTPPLPESVSSTAIVPADDAATLPSGPSVPSAGSMPSASPSQLSGAGAVNGSSPIGVTNLPGASGLPGAGSLPTGLASPGLPGAGTGLPGVGAGLPGVGPVSPLAMVFPPLAMFQLFGVNPLQPASMDGVNRLVPQNGLFRTYGWLDGGTIINPSQPASRYNGPYNAVDSTDPMFNQAYLVMELKRPEYSDFGIGGRIDFLYGNDFFLAQSVGFETNRDGSPKWNDGQDYGFAIPQGYLEVGGDELSVQVGHFYTVVGYEGVQSAYNFFYSHAYSYQFAGPFTQWGGLVTWKPDSSNWEVQAGPVNGWNTLDSIDNEVNFLGRVKYTGENRDWWTSFAIISGNQTNNVAGLPGITPETANRTRYSFLIDKKFGDSLEYVFHQWLGLQQNGTASGSTANWYGIDQYAFYTLNKQWKVGGRVEWFRDEEGTRVGLNRRGNPNKPPLPGNYVSLTAGPNYSPSPNLVIRPELRYDIYQGSARPFDDGKKAQQFMLGIDVIVKF